MSPKLVFCLFYLDACVGESPGDRGDRGDALGGQGVGPVAGRRPESQRAAPPSTSCATPPSPSGPTAATASATAESDDLQSKCTRRQSLFSNFFI